MIALKNERVYTSLYQLRKGKSGGLAFKYFYMIYRVGRTGREEKRFPENAGFAPVAGPIFGPLSERHISKSDFQNEISGSALLDIQLTLLCVWSGFIYPRIRTFDRKKIWRSLFQKEAVEILFIKNRSWNEAEVNFLPREKLSRPDYLDCLKNEAKSGDMAVLEIRSL